MAQCERCGVKDADQYYWHGDIQEDYDMGDYDCLCGACFNYLNTHGRITWTTT